MFIKLHGCAHDLTGRRFGRLVPLGPVERIYVQPRGTVVVWLCQCDCGKTSRVYAQSLRNKNTKSCGCLNEEKRAARLAAQVTHGATGTHEYWVWNAAKRRCHNKKDKGYHNYGGRGITMCARWRDDFAAFIADMGPRPSPDHTIERVDNNRGYEPDNCEWVTIIPQANNRRNNRLLTAFGKTQTIAQWSRECNVSQQTLWSRVFSYGWSVGKALSTPRRMEPTCVIIAFGRSQTYRAWSKETGLCSSVIRERVKLGWHPEKAVSTPVRAQPYKVAA